MFVSKIDYGIVLDHIERGKGLELFKELAKVYSEVPGILACNLESQKLGRKDLIKFKFDENADLQKIIDAGIPFIKQHAQNCTVTVISSHELKDKYKPSELEGKQLQFRHPTCRYGKTIFVGREVADIEKGIVFDHLKCGIGLQLIDFFTPEELLKTYVLGINFKSEKYTKKDFLKTESQSLSHFQDILSFLQSNSGYSTINVIKDRKVILKGKPEGFEYLKQVF